MIEANPGPIVRTRAGRLRQNRASKEFSRKDHSVPTVDETLAQAKAHHNAGQLSQAALLYQQIVAADSGNVEAHFLLGAARHGLSQPQDAIASLSEVLRLQPDHVEAIRCLGVVLAESGRLDEAATLLQRAVQLRPDFAAAHMNLAAILAKQGKLGDALLICRRAVELAGRSTDDASAYEMLLRYLELGKRAFPPPHKLLLARAATKDWRLLEQMEWLWRGYSYGHEWPAPETSPNAPDPGNPLRAYFEAHEQGRGIWKWLHYFDIYDRHFASFRNREVHILEIGIYSGGSLLMWKEYFGPKARIYGVDIEPLCKAFEDDSTKVFIGDQEDPDFWKRFKEEVPTLDIVIDDGGHQPNQQIVTLEELLPHLRPGGIYLCEDAIAPFNQFASYVSGLMHELHTYDAPTNEPSDLRERFICQPTGFQSAIHSIHSYPFVTVIEKRKNPLSEFVSARHGTEWEPFLK